MNGEQRPREIRYSQRFDQEKGEIDRDVQRIDEALRWVETVLARNPEFGLQSEVAEIWIAPMVFAETTSSARGASIFYRFDDDFVDLLSIRADIW